ncbi:intestinal mucin-like protein [Genypterus blacodes]|uniref:intestinal mucin-like protein n=1 Tax=Genypterus blacodes TaxID=154954 RepID=UPI003F76BD63
MPSGTTTAGSSGPGVPSGTTTAGPSGPGVPSGTTTAGPSGPGVPSDTTTQGPRVPLSEMSMKPGPCQECYCGPRMDPITKLNIIHCKPIVCKTDCNKGHEYQAVAGKCCGKCVQKKCIFSMPDKTTKVIEVNGTYVTPGDKCVKYTCEKIGDQFVTKEVQHNCPPFNPLDCEPGTETTDSDGCCKTCKPKKMCEVKSKETVIEVNGCKSLPVNITSCAGQCGSSSIYSAKANAIMHQCECCQETKTSTKKVELRCANGSKRISTYIFVEACRCHKAKCVEWAVGSKKERGKGQ